MVLDRNWWNWQAEVRRRRSAMRDNPQDVTLADSVWRIIAGEAGIDARSYGGAVSVFRSAVFASTEGVASFARALREMDEEIQSLTVSPELIDLDMERAITRATIDLDGVDLDNVTWLCRAYGLPTKQVTS